MPAPNREPPDPLAARQSARRIGLDQWLLYVRGNPAEQRLAE
jgi:hypothetical protein